MNAGEISLEEKYAAFATPKVSASVTAEEEIALLRRSAEASTVLLKNEKKLLPMGNRVRTVTVIGDLGVRDGDDCRARVLSLVKAERPDVTVRFARGYRSEEARGEGLYPEAVRLAEESDLVVLLVGWDEAREARAARLGLTELPANQLALVEELLPYAKKTVVAVSSGLPIGIGALSPFRALLFAPVFTAEYGIDAVISTLLGTFSPTGRLTSALYADARARQESRLGYRDKYGISIGAFLGYRYDELMEYPTAYPFGFGRIRQGLRYSRLRIAEDVLTFTVKNTGKLPIGEAVQVYIGICGRTVRDIRPWRELCGLARVTLAPGEKRELSIPIALPEWVRREDGRAMTEQRRYTVEIGPSMNEIRLRARYRGGEEAVNTGEEEISDYVEGKSNIHRGKYLLEARYRIMKRSKKNFIAGIGALLLSLGLKVYGVMSFTDDLFLNIVSVVLLVGAVYFFLSELFDRKKGYDEARSAIDLLNEETFHGAEELSGFSVDGMFREEPVSSSASSATRAREEENDELPEADKNASFKSIGASLVSFLGERGCVVNESGAYSLLSAFCSSRLLVVSGMEEKDFRYLFGLMGEFFASPEYVDRVDVGYRSAGALIAEEVYAGRVKERAFCRAVTDAAKHCNRIHLAQLCGVTAKQLPLYVTPLTKYARSPIAETVISSTNSSGDTVSYRIPKNLWVALCLKEDESVSLLPANVTEVCAVLRGSFRRGECADTRLPHQPVTFSTIDYLIGRATVAQQLDEELWKRIDRLCSAVGEGNFALGNHPVRGIERYASVYLACGGDAVSAADRAMAARLLPSLMILPQYADDRGALTALMSEIFSDDAVEGCRELLRAHFSEAYAQDEGSDGE